MIFKNHFQKFDSVELEITLELNLNALVKFSNMVCSMRPQTPRLRINSESIDGGTPSNRTQTTSSMSSFIDISSSFNLPSNIRIESTGEFTAL